MKSKESKKKEDLGSNFDGEGKEWSETEIEILKKQMVKNPVGKPGRGQFLNKTKLITLVETPEFLFPNLLYSPAGLSCFCKTQ